MNLGSLIMGILGSIVGKDFMSSTGWNTNSEDTYTDLGGTLDNVFAKYSGSRLTSAEQQANAFSAQQSALAFQREADFQREMFDKQTELANTQYQRTVADMQAAGINPMMAVRSSGAAVPSGGTASSSAPQSVSPGSMGNIFPSILNAILRGKEMKLQEKAVNAEVARSNAEVARSNADVELKKSEADKNAVQTEGFSLDNQVKQLTMDAQVESASLRNKLDRSNVRLIENKADEASASVRKMAAETSESAERSAYYEASAILQKATAYQIVELLPFEKAYKAAATQNQKDAAALAAAHAAYQNHLIDDGYLDAFIREAKAEAGSAESREELDNIKAAIRTGDYSKVHHQYGLSRDVLSVFAILLDNFNPLGGLLK